MNSFIFIPGGKAEVKELLNFSSAKYNSILIIGSGQEKIALILAENFDAEITIIVEENESLSVSRFILAEEKKIKIKLMDFTSTDFQPEAFDLIYSQASVSDSRRNKIIKEIRRILKPAGIFSVGEMVSKTSDIPPFVKNIFENSGIVPLNIDEIKNYYSERNFNILFEKDLSFSLKDFYKKGKQLLEKKDETLSERELSYYKKFIKKISHESNVYLKLGGNAYIGFVMLIMEKNP